MIFKAIISTLAFLSYASGAVLDVSVSKDVEATPSTSITTGSAIAILASGVYVASGSTNGNVASTPASGATNQVMRAFADNGTALYTEQIAATGSEATFLASATDADDNIYQVGMCVGSWYGGLWRGNGDVCVAKYDQSGNYILSVQTGSPDYNSPTAIALNPDQSFYTVGISGGGAWNDIPGIGSWDAFVIKYANTGTVAKVARFGVKGLLTTFTGAAIDSLSNVEKMDD